jgi:hypothetical protein
MRLLYAEHMEDGKRSFALRAQRNLVRAALIFAVFGLLPALAISAVLSPLLARLIIR